MDPLTTMARSELMAKVRAKGNESTEKVAVNMLRQAGITGWRRHPKRILGRPDFYFSKAKLVLFVDGCFWHACPVCRRNSPRTREEFWREKIDSNRRRDNRTRRSLRALGYRVFRVWEHEIRKTSWITRLRVALTDGSENLLL
jgi:DNA mismatch endonuclease, patch repair protein